MDNYQFLTERGLIIPDTSDIRGFVIGKFQDAFGVNIDTDPASLSGVLITMFVELLDAVSRNNAELANQLNPDIATGVFLDAIFALTDPNGRRPATRSIINSVELTGEPNTIVPAGTICADSNSQQWALTDQKVLDNNGQAFGDFIAAEYGAVECAAHQLQTIVTSVLGLIAIDNSNSAVLGRGEETNAQVRRRRRKTLAIQASSTPEAIQSRLAALETYHSHQFLENVKDTVETIEGITLQPHSIWACVRGATDLEVATALFESKDAGAGYNGAQTVNITDPRSLVDYPVSFDRPDEIPLLIRVTVKPTTLDAVNLIPELVMNYVNGLVDGDKSFEVGVDVSPWEIAGAINQQEPRLSVLLVEIDDQQGGGYSSAVYNSALNEIAITQRNSITVVI